MKKKLLAISVFSAVLAGCGGGGDVEIAPSTNVVDSNNTTNNNTGGGGGGGSDNPCASYTNENGQTRQGAVVDSDCVYGASFASVGNPVTGDVTFDDLPNDGAHIFDDSLFIGKNFDSDADLQAAGISQGGDGPTLTLRPGVTLAFQTSSDFMVINRGSQIQAEGTVNNPITITSVSDIEDRVHPEAVSEWGGLVINGFGVTNKCDYEGNLNTGSVSLVGECHIPSEGSEGAAANNYGGDNNADSSGTLRYFIVKHTGAEVANGDELNGITFGAVGSGTVVENLQTYSTFDDGIEMFGGAVNVKNYVGLYTNDDTLDFDEGYRGTVENALVIQSETDGSRCIEADGIGNHSSLDPAVRQDFIDRGLNTLATVRNLTCIVSPVAAQADGGTGTHDPGQGVRFREGYFPTIENMILTTAYQGDAQPGNDNWCVRIDNEGQQAALDGDLTISSSVVACQDLTNGATLADSGITTEEWLRDNGGNAVYQSAEQGENPSTSHNLQILDGFYSLPIDQMVVGGSTPNVTPASGAGFIGAVIADDDWTQGWTYGLHPENRGQPLWFE